MPGDRDGERAIPDVVADIGSEEVDKIDCVAPATSSSSLIRKESASSTRALVASRNSSWTRCLV